MAETFALIASLLSSALGSTPSIVILEVTPISPQWMSMRSIIATASSGQSPAAVSAESITASAPS